MKTTCFRLQYSIIHNCRSQRSLPDRLHFLKSSPTMHYLMNIELTRAFFGSYPSLLGRSISSLIMAEIDCTIDS